MGSSTPSAKEHRFGAPQSHQPRPAREALSERDKGTSVPPVRGVVPAGEEVAAARDSWNWCSTFDSGVGGGGPGAN